MGNKIPDRSLKNPALLVTLDNKVQKSGKKKTETTGSELDNVKYESLYSL
jgi:hypothetical protein